MTADSYDATGSAGSTGRALQVMGTEGRALDFFKLREFPHLSAAAFQHPLDVQAIAGIRKIPFLSKLMKALSSSFFEKQVWLMNISGTVQLGPNQAPSIYQKFIKAATILDLPKLPEVYVSSQYIINASAFGIENYQITLYAGLIDFMTEDELLAIIGHELGHVKCQHMLYTSMAYILRNFGVEILNNLLPSGTGVLASIPLQLAILHWERMAEFSCDRAALLVVQDPAIVASALTKLAGGSKKILPELNLESVMQQAQKYDEASDKLIEKLLKIQIMLLQTHPFPIVRAKEIMDWAYSEEYQKILQGDYIRDAPPIALALPEPVGAICPNCQCINSAVASFCFACGNRLREARLICTNCEAQVQSNWKICPRCGEALKEAGVK